MDHTVLNLARLQFGVTLTYHFWFVALTLGLSVLIALMETHYVQTGDTGSKVMAKFWGKLFLVNYTVGIVTGLVNAFQFGTNWPGYSRFAGSVIGSLFAFEALTAFFVESVAIGIWVYGWDKISGRAHLAVIWLVAVAGNYSAFWILSANSFMQHPMGYALNHGRVEMNDLAALLTNPYLFYQYVHTILSGLVVTGYFVMAVSAYYLLRREHVPLFRRSFKLGLACALAAVIFTAVSGHFYNRYIASVQPMKMAASEALWETAAPAPFAVVAVIDEDNRRNTYQMALPAGLSLLVHSSPRAAVKGLNELQAEYEGQYGPGDYIPAVTILFWSFRIMVGIGLWLVLLTAVLGWYWWKRQLECRPALLKATLWNLPLSYVAVTMGWIMTEMGRQPWVLYGLLPTAEGVTRGVPAAVVGTSLLIYAAVYGGVAWAAVYAGRRILLDGPEPGQAIDGWQ